jgi:hypothetical protein
VRWQIGRPVGSLLLPCYDRTCGPFLLSLSGLKSVRKRSWKGRVREWLCGRLGYL